MRHHDQRRDTITWHNVALLKIHCRQLPRSEKFAWDESRKTWLTLDKWGRLFLLLFADSLENYFVPIILVLVLITYCIIVLDNNHLYII